MFYLIFYFLYFNLYFFLIGKYLKMFSIITNKLFGKKELSDEELLTAFQNSNKTYKDFCENILKIKNNLYGIVLNEISNIRFKNIKELEEFEKILDKKGFNEGLNMSTNKYKKKLIYISSQFQFLINIYKNYLPNEDLVHFIFSNKFEIFTYLIKNIDKNESIKELLYKIYFTKDSYLSLLDYFLIIDNENNLKFLLPNFDNQKYLLELNSIPQNIDITKIIKNINNKNLNELWLNLIIYYQKNPEQEQFNTLNKYYPENNFEDINKILNLYSLAIKVNLSMSLYDFLKNKNISNLFKNCSLLEYDNFTKLISNIITFTKENIDNYIGIKYVPINILQFLLLEKAKTKYINFTIDEIMKSKLYDKKLVTNLIIKLLFQNYSDSLQYSIELANILNHFSKNNNEITDLRREVDKSNDFSTILDKKKIKFTLKDIIKLEKGNNEQIKLAICDYLNRILEENLFDNRFDIIDQNIFDIKKLLNFREGISLGQILIKFFSIYSSSSSFILNIISDNKNLNLTNEEKRELIDIFLQNNSNNPSIYENIEKYINENGNSDPQLLLKLESLLEYMNISKTFKQYQIDTDLLNEYNVNNYKEVRDEILEIFLIKVFNIDDIKSISDFIQKRPSQDIQKALRLTDNKYLYNLFLFFIKYKVNYLSNEILNIFIEKNEKKYFNKCIDKLYNDIFQKDEQKFKEFIKNNSLKLFLIENNNSSFINILNEQIDFSKTPKVNFILDKENNDLLSIYSLIDNQKEKYKDNKYQDLINTFDEFNNLNKEEKTLSKLFEIYDEGVIINEDDGINYNYSLHPKLIKLLTEKNLIDLIQNIKINYNSKIDIYKFCLKGKICSLNNILEYENINLKKNINENDIEEILRLLFNIYEDYTYNDIDSIMNNKLNNIQYDKNQTINSLIQYNLNHKVYLSFNNLLFLSNHLGYNLPNNEQERKILSLLSKISKKINIFPFTSNFSNEYENYKSILDKYYLNFYNILTNCNSKFFDTLKNPILKYLLIEIYNIINMNNFATLKKIIQGLNIIEINVFFILLLKMTLNFISLSSVIPEQLNYGINTLINLFMTFNLPIEEIKIIIEDIINLPTMTFILDSSRNILLLDGNIKNQIKGYFKAKNDLLNEIIKLYKNELSKFPLLLISYRIFKVKNCIINAYNDKEEIQKIFNSIRTLDNYNDLYDIVRENDILRNEIYNVYSS